LLRSHFADDRPPQGYCAMLSELLSFIQSHYAFYTRYFSNAWDHMTPAGYGTLLICIGIFGWCLMKAGNKRS
jgi:hypothetical protein